jgi:radical SAM protein with 4Fe4S-binding SPASM domain
MGYELRNTILYLAFENNIMTPKEKYHLFRTNKKFCVAPWTSFQVYADGRVATCSIGKETLGNVNDKSVSQILSNNPIVKRIKTNMLNNVADTNCTICDRRSIDEDGFEYYRDHLNKMIEDKDIDYNDIDNFDLRSIDLHWSNICNLRCVMCRPSQSSLIAKDEGVTITPVTKDTISKITEMIVKNQYKIREIYLSGGEPFYIPQNVELLKKLSNKDVPIRINTNMHWNENNRLFKILKTFNNVNLTMSVDALHEKFNYIRNGAEWEVFIKNFQYIKKNTNFDIRINTIFSVMNADDLCANIKYFYQEQNIKNITINVLYRPKELSARNYPLQKKQLIIDQIEKLMTQIAPEDVNLIGNLKNCITQIKSDNQHDYKDALDRVTKKNKKPWQTVLTDLV